MSLRKLGFLFIKNTAPVLLSELLSDRQPRTAKQIHNEIPINNIAQVSKRANEVLRPHGLEIRTQSHPSQKTWLWFLADVSEVVDIKKARR